MKVVILSQYYSPEAVAIPEQLAHGLVARGHEVRVVTGFPNYPAGKLFPGYRQRLKHFERHGSIVVRRVPLVTSHSMSAIGRIANYVSFAFSALIAGRFVRHADVVYVYATPMTSALAPQIWRAMRQTPFVLHVQDMWPESITGSGMIRSRLLGSIIERMLTPWLRLVYQSASSIIGIAPTMTSVLIERGAPVNKCHTVLNWGNEPSTETEVSSATRPISSTGCTVMYAGNMGDLQDLESVIQAASRVRDLPGFRLVLHGDGIARGRLERLARELGAANVEFRSRVKPVELERSYYESDFQMVTLKDLPIFRGTIPSKFQSSLALGVPVISTVRGDVSVLIEQNQLGFLAEPENAGSIELAFRKAYASSPTVRSQMAERAKSFYESSMSFERGVSQIESILKEACARNERENRHAITL